MSVEDAKNKIMTALGERELGKMVSLDIAGSELIVRIKKLGESILKFNHQIEGKELCINLIDEKIAFTHRAFKDDVKAKLCSIVKATGGKVVE